MNNPHRTSIVVWLWACIILTVSMVALGGYTRLSGSGLSMVTWHPISGMVPPLSDGAWMQEFAAYQQSPEYVQVNQGMGLEAFKRIFLVEYLHRVLGRLFGLIFFLPFVWFWAQKKLPPFAKKNLSLVFVLGCVQGGLGWYMVKSGLVDSPSVSPMRLAAHLLMAISILSLLFWTLMRYQQRLRHNYQAVSRYSQVVLGLVSLTIFYGALVAGTKAGLIYNTFPLMQDSLLPPDAWYFHPLWRNFYENPTMVQFLHRVLAFLSFVGALGTVYMSRHHPRIRVASYILAAAVFIQLSLGVATLLTVVWWPIALIHQVWAVVTFLCLLNLVYQTKNPDTYPHRG